MFPLWDNVNLASEHHELSTAVAVLFSCTYNYSPYTLPVLGPLLPCVARLLASCPLRVLSAFLHALIARHTPRYSYHAPTSPRAYHAFLPPPAAVEYSLGRNRNTAAATHRVRAAPRPKLGWRSKTRGKGRWGARRLIQIWTKGWRTALRGRPRSGCCGDVWGARCRQ